MSAPATMPADPGAAPTRGAWLREVWRSSIGKKVIVAISGGILAAYVLLHVLGNLKAFQGADAGGAPIDSYAEFLRTVGDPVVPRSGILWAVRAILIVALVLHVVGVVQLSKRNAAARPAGNNAKRIARSFSSRTMLPGGLFLLAFIVFHILQFTTGTINSDEYIEGAVYRNLYEAFQNPLFVAVYVGVSIVLGLHLRHGIWSTTQTAGWDKPNRNPTIRRSSNFLAVAIAVGFAAVPLAFWTGILEAPA
ncbi:MAG: succinate dehydrogenase cytochrome b subunit [Solirubrobacterales bacterium]